MTNEYKHILLEDVLDELMLQEPEPSHDVLMNWIERYPEHREALARFFATWAVQKELPGQVAVNEARVGNLMVSHALNILHRQESGYTTDSEATASSRLSDAITASGMSEEEFASRCNLDDSIIAKFDRRLIRPASIPRICLERMGRALGRAAAVIITMVSGGVIRLHSYKSRRPPESKVEDFLDAVETSDLSDETKRQWAQAVDAEGSEERM